MSKEINPKWQAGHLQWGHEIHSITKEAEKELEKLKTDHPDWNFEQLAEDVKNSKVKAWL